MKAKRKLSKDCRFWPDPSLDLARAGRGMQVFNHSDQVYVVRFSDGVEYNSEDSDIRPGEVMGFFKGHHLKNYLRNFSKYQHNLTDTCYIEQIREAEGYESLP